MNIKPGAGIADDFQHLDQVLERATEPIGGPDGQHVELATHGSLQQCIELRTLVAPLGATDAGIFVDAHNRVAGPFGPGLKLLSLGLVFCASVLTRTYMATRFGFDM